uniref:YtkA-like domain-containing protein n=1 Tax=Acidobacterium capsulatum TaxID=33075 RepID=A0A7V4XTF1_9BACT
MKRYLLLPLILFVATHAWADGGRLQFRKPAGPFVVTLFTTPDPLTPGRADFSVVVEKPGTQGIVNDARVTFVLTQADGHGEPITLQATHGQATTRFLEAANFSLPKQGLWKIAIHVSHGAESGVCAGEFRVAPPNLITNEVAWQIAIVPLIMLLFFLHQWRKRVVARQRTRSIPSTGSTPSSNRI